ncbi:MAG: GAF domain-containing protein [Proteobacteria bacterium]|nr:GAF domain-containing protein [Pseudomonadota bacterium]
MMSDQTLKEQITKLNRIGIALSSETNLERLLDLIVRESRSFSGADAGSLYIRQNDHLRFEVAQNDTLKKRDASSEEKFRPFPLPLTKKSIAGYVALTGKALNINDVYQLDETMEFSFNREFDQRNDYRTRSMLVIPMMDNRQENIGVLQLINALDEDGRVIPFTNEVEDLCLSLASQAAVAIRNAQLIASIKNIFAALLQYSASAIDARSPHTAGHSQRVARMAHRLAEAINRQRDGLLGGIRFSEEELEELLYSAWLHDLGKIGVPERVLEKSTKLEATRLALIESRFERFKMSVRNEFQARLIERLRQGPVDPDETAELERDRDCRLKGLDEEIELIVRLNTPGWVGDEDLARLRAIAAKQFTDETGRTVPYIDEYELKNLAVAKGNLTEEEYRVIQSHVVHTLNIVEKIPFTPELSRIPDFAAAHHEMLNGTGYPNGLKGEQIPLQARILGVVDIFDALVASDRPYKKALPLDKALAILEDEVKVGRLDGNLVDLFIKERIWAEQDAGAARE